MIKNTSILIIVGVSEDLFSCIQTQEFQEQLLLLINSELRLGCTKRGLFCSPILACTWFQTSLSHFFPCCFAHVRGALCKHLQASCFRAPFEISCARKAAETWQGDSGWFSVSIASPAEKYVLRGFGAPFVFSVSTCFLLYELSWGKKLSFFVAVTGLFDSRDSQLPIPWL